MSKILNEVNTFLLPVRCFGCNAHLYRGESLLCAFCRHDLPITEYHLGAENPLDRLFYGESDVWKASALFHFEAGGVVQGLIHRLKYQGHRHLGSYFGHWLGLQLAADPELGSVDWVLPVPLHWRRHWKRGYNQCHDLARTLAGHTGGRFSARMLQRQRYRRTQTARGRAARLGGSEGIFRVRHPAKLEGKRILLVDDVITTGATLRACCQALEAVRTKEVLIAAIAAVP